MKFKILLKEANKVDANGDIFTEEALRNCAINNKDLIFEHGKLFYFGNLNKNDKMSMESRSDGSVA
jgi:hypothetical protein